MAKKNSTFFCKECGFETTGWTGKCPSCGEWNTMTEASSLTDSPKSKGKESPIHSANQFSWTNSASTINLADAYEDVHTGFSSGMPTLDSLLGGRITDGAVILIGGEPGIGKSTILLQICNTCDVKGEGRIFYASGEESPGQIALRADRLGVDKKKITVCSKTCFEELAAELTQAKPAFCIIDSIQTLYSENINGTPGSVSQAREVTAGLVRLAKTNNMPIFLVGHITKDGAIAGPKTLEHMVDTVLYFEGENLGNLRVLRSIKNRYGRSGEVAFFEMTESGLQEILNPQSVLVSGHPVNVPGSAITSTIEGSRAIALEVQALMTPSGYSNAQRMSTGLDRNRITMLLAVADKFLKLSTPSFDSFINVIGGLKVQDTALDLAVIAAVVSSVRELPIKTGTMILGEVGLSGEIRPVTSLRQRIACAKQAGITTLVLPSACKKAIESGKNKQTTNSSEIGNKTAGNCDKIVPLDYVYVDNLAEAIDVLFS